MIKVGLTGGIGAGKSLIAKVFKTLGVPVYSSDLRAKQLMYDPQVKKLLIQEFGQIFLPDGSLDKQKLANLIFNDQLNRKKINSIIHPRVEQDFLTWAENQTYAYVIKESALLFESGNYKNLDFIITVYAPEDLRIERTMLRDKISREQVLLRMASQLDDNFKVAKADFVIINDEQSAILPQIINLHKFFLKQNG